MIAGDGRKAASTWRRYRRSCRWLWRISPQQPQEADAEGGEGGGERGGERGAPPPGGAPPPSRAARSFRFGYSLRPCGGGSIASVGGRGSTMSARMWEASTRSAGDHTAKGSG